MSNPYTLLADAVRDFIQSKCHCCELHFGEYESWDGQLSFSLRVVNSAVPMWELLQDYPIPEGVQVNTIHGRDNTTGMIYFYEAPVYGRP
jgi:hypothetical protein